MKYAKIFTLSSALIVAATVFGASAEARKSDSDQCTASGLNKAECACVMALEKGTKKALRDYLKMYRTADTACNARASTEITKNSNDDETSSTTPSSTPSTPSAKDNNGLGNGDEGGCSGGGCSDPDNPGNGSGSSGGNGGNGGNGNKH